MRQSKANYTDYKCFSHFPISPIFLAMYAAWLAYFAVTCKANVTATAHTQVH
jgi:hypothetical protein